MTDAQFIRQILPYLKDIRDLCDKQGHNPNIRRAEQIWTDFRNRVSPVLNQYLKAPQDHTQANFFDLTEVKK